MLNLANPDLTQHPPRSPRVQLGGYVHLPRLLDKARATIAGKAGEYHYNCPLDKHFFAFTGIDSEALLAEIKKGLSDSDLLTWIRAHTKRHASEIAGWCTWMRGHAPGGAGGHEWFAEVIKQHAAGRDDIFGFFDLLDMDDYASYGGKP
jgi:Domain of unknown function (DUF5069)